jgi:hypothetical protein
MKKAASADIEIRLNAAGFTVSSKHISKELKNPLWQANANRDGQEWSAFARDLESALIELERQTRETVVDWRKAIALEKLRLAAGVTRTA